MVRVCTSLFALLIVSIGFGQEPPKGMFTLGIPESIPARSAEVENYTSSIDFPPLLDWSTDGKFLLFNGGFEIYKMRRPNGQVSEVDRLSEYFGYFRLDPGQRRLVFQEQRAGNEDYEIFVHDLQEQTTLSLSTPGARSHSPRWSPDGSQLVYQSNQTKEDRIDLFIANPSGEEPFELLFTNIGDEGSILDWSAGRNQLLLCRTLCEYDKQLFLLDLDTKHAKPLLANQLELDFRSGYFLESQNAILLLSDQFGDHLNLVWYDLENQQSTPMTEFQWDIESFVINQEETWGAFVVNRDGVHQLYRISLFDHSIEAIPFAGPQGIIRDLRMHPIRPEVAFNYYGSTFRRIGVSCDLEKKNWKVWTTGKLNLRRGQVVEPEAFRYATHDGDSIPCMIYWPEISKRTSCPVWIDIHGGPEFQARPLYNPWYQYLTKRLGVAVVVPNIRGSSGYGKSFLRADDHFLRENAIRDVGALLDWIKDESRLDEEKTLIHGQSYGGYVAMASLLAYPDQIKAGINVVGMADLVSFLENT
ncbi:MAG: prolyl oligopeptidase family serine peptidase, partial [Bacteroidota bacterium]